MIVDIEQGYFKEINDIWHQISDNQDFLEPQMDLQQMYSSISLDLNQFLEDKLKNLSQETE